MRSALLLLCLLVLTNVFGQTSGSVIIPDIKFIAAPEQQHGLDVPGIGKPERFYETIRLRSGKKFIVPYKSVGYRKAEKIQLIIKAKRRIELSRLEFRVNDSSEVLSYLALNDTLLELSLPQKTKKFSVSAKYFGETIAKLNVEVYRPRLEKIRIVQLVEGDIDREYLEEFLNEIYKQANVRVKIDEIIPFADNILAKEGALNNPSALNDRYTAQMRRLRDRFFEREPKASKDCYYLFLVPGFVDPSIDGYMVRDHAIGFIKWQNEPDMFHTIARELGHGIGMLDHYWISAGTEKGTTLNLMDSNGGSELQCFQWRQLRHPSRSYNFYDPDEDLRTNNGLVAYYFWKEDRHGFIRFKDGSPLSSIHRPFKKNYLSYHLNISDELFNVLIEWNGYMICVWHVIIIGATVVLWIFVRVITLIRRRRKLVKQGFLKRKMKDWVVNVIIAGIGLSAFFSIGFFLKRHEVTSGLITAFSSKSTQSVMKEILYNRNLRYDAVNSARSEILLKRKGRWYMKRRKKVLYFDVYRNEEGVYDRCVFRSDADRLLVETAKYDQEASSHYTVFSYRDDNDSLELEKVYNHLGKDITKKLNVSDAAKRILVFVNGYRPTSIGHSLEENFADVQNKGLEFPNSSNLIFDFDRYNYWRPWQKMDLRFIKRINPTETYYADGHFSVSTSNHRSLLNFTQLTSQYPKRCKDTKKHTCYKTKIVSTGLFGDKQKDTYTLLPQSPNRKGFRERMDNGRIAAKNLLMMFNELPNKSSNDTIYLVVHSMGYAYALGMIEELRGKIHFGGFYIIAPENANQGKVRKDEWQEIWQYGSRLNKRKKDAPCIQDGVAPQTGVRGLGEAQRVYFPSFMYNRRSFFESHFIGNYTWIFDIAEDQKGCVKQR